MRQVPAPKHRLKPHDEAGTPSYLPPGAMWPEEGSGFEPSYYSPAGQLLQEAQIVSNISRDPTGVWRAVTRSWGVWILGVGLLVTVLAAVVSAAL